MGQGQSEGRPGGKGLSPLPPPFPWLHRCLRGSCAPGRCKLRWRKMGTRQGGDGFVVRDQDRRRWVCEAAEEEITRSVVRSGICKSARGGVTGVEARFQGEGTWARPLTTRAAVRATRSCRKGQDLGQWSYRTRSAANLGGQVGMHAIFCSCRKEGPSSTRRRARPGDVSTPPISSFEA